MYGNSLIEKELSLSKNLEVMLNLTLFYVISYSYLLLFGKSCFQVFERIDLK